VTDRRHPAGDVLAAFRFTCVLELETRGDRDPRAVIYRSAGDAAGAGVHPDTVEGLFAESESQKRPACETVGEVRRDGIWVRYRNNDCPSDLGWLSRVSWPRDQPRTSDDEGEGTWALPGRVYQCDCIYVS
jgi:hypothetical protein